MNKECKRLKKGATTGDRHASPKFLGSEEEGRDLTRLDSPDRSIRGKRKIFLRREERRRHRWRNFSSTNKRRLENRARSLRNKIVIPRLVVACDIRFARFVESCRAKKEEVFRIARSAFIRTSADRSAENRPPSSPLINAPDPAFARTKQRQENIARNKPRAN